MLLEDKIAVITGAGSGVGRASALRFAEEGASVVCADIDLDRAKETVAQIEAAGGRPSPSAATSSRTPTSSPSIASAVEPVRAAGHHVQQRGHPDAPPRHGVRGPHGRGLRAPDAPSTSAACSWAASTP